MQTEVIAVHFECIDRARGLVRLAFARVGASAFVAQRALARLEAVRGRRVLNGVALQPVDLDCG